MAAKRIGLALSGGGSKGSFTVGVISVLRAKLGLTRFRVISGTSTGSLVGTLLTTNEWAKLRQVYRNVTTENIVNPHRALVARLLGPEAVLFAQAILGGTAVFDSTALRLTIRNTVDFDLIRGAADKTLLIYNTVNMQSGCFETFDNRRHGNATLEKALLASASVPVFMDPVPIRGDQHTDGGVIEWLPLRAVYDSGVDLDHIIAIGTSPLRARKQSATIDDIIGVLGRTIDLLLSEVGRTDYSGALLFNTILQMIDNAEQAGVSRARILSGVPAEVKRRLQGKRAIPVTFIGPASHIKMESLEFVPEDMRKAMSAGVQAGKRALPKLQAALA